ncbi:hypothetical protein ACLQ2S_26315 [Micromonospora sp. DT48]|uniref:hypothetical protein n=1 Tax=unclassified Micromonospora TaxID=2617518 RepID=UPI0012BC4161|nr:hypothetical protein [Micromonospora sp. CP22]MTK05377.1 hypothetical protein [Micromonospora sp. CP22]
MDTSEDWREILDLITAWGEASRRNDTALPTDDELWAHARRHRTLRLPAQVDDLIVDDLRDAFNAGRLPHLIDLDVLVANLAQQGRPALVEHSGGNTATVRTGSRYTDRPGDTRWSVSAGPGWFAAPGRRRPLADTSEFTIGPHDEDSWSVLVPEHTTTAQVTALVIATIDEVEARRARLAATASAAAGAVVRVVAARYPELGPAVPDPGRELVRDVGDLIADWLHARVPALRAAPPTITDQTSSQEGTRP